MLLQGSEQLDEHAAMNFLYQLLLLMLFAGKATINMSFPLNAPALNL